jgi:transcriptional regulator with XRE-family HTH domain
VGKEEQVTYERLRIARESLGWSIEDLARHTGIRPRTIELIDRGAFAELPAGLYSRSSIRSYAAAVGLDPAEMVESILPLLSVPEDPLDGLARLRGHARRVEAKPQEAPAAAAVTQPAPRVAPAVEPAAPRIASGGIGQWWRPLAASGIDGVLLAVMAVALVWLTALACGTDVASALLLAGPGIAVVFSLIVALYFVLFGGVGNATLGVWIMRLDTRPSGRTALNPRDVFGRARRSAFHDGSGARWGQVLRKT